ncbi:hypothetical protein FACS189447_07870 [Spirochaetia bacterium]|nr:hypothetical protein FACS189447_07870 [Spirochaetia bacterium]
MAINDKDLDDKITAAFDDYNNGQYKNEMKTPKHLKILGDTMKEYFEENTIITYGWSAKLPPPANTPDPVTSFNSEVFFPVFDLTAASDLITLAALVQAAIIGGIINHPAGFSIPPGSFLAFTPLVYPPQGSLDGAFFNAITKPTCAWVLTCKNPAPLAGTHASYIGATTNMGIK